MANPPHDSNSKVKGYNDTRSVTGSVDGASRMKPVIGNKKPTDSDKKK